MSDTEFSQLRNTLREALNLDVLRGILGDANGRIYVQGQPGLLYVRLAASDGNYTTPAIARVGGTFSVRPGAPVVLKRDADGALAIVTADFAAQIQAGYDPRANNAADQNIYGYISQRQLTTLRCQPVPSALAVSVKAWVYVDAQAQLQEFAGGTLALTSPAAGEHYLASIFLAGNVLEVQYSTAKVLADALDSADVQECLDARSPSAVPICVWRVVGGATQLLDTDLYYDFRQVLNLPQLKHNYGATSAPSASNDDTQGFSVGSVWVDTSADVAYICVDNATGAAVWVMLDGSAGSVTSVALTMPSDYAVSGSPVTSNGTFGVTRNTQGSREVLIAPNGGGVPVYRAFETADVASGTFDVARGGTGQATLTAESLLVGDGTSPVKLVAPSSSGNLLTSNGTAWQSTAPSFAASVITSGTLALARGGTNADLSATGGANQFVKQTSVGGAFTVAAIASGDLTTALTTPPPIGSTTPNTAAFATSFQVTEIVQPTFNAPADGSFNLNVLLNTYGSTATGTRLIGRKARGTQASPSAVSAGDELLGFDARGYTGSAYVSNAAGGLFFLAAQDWTTTATGTLVRALITLDGTTTQAIGLDLRTLSGATALIVNGAGAAPSSTLDVVGSVEISSSGNYYLGDPSTDGTWRTTRSGNSLVVQRRVSGTYNTWLEITETGAHKFLQNDANDSGVSYVLEVAHDTTGTPANNLGTGIVLQAETSTTPKTNLLFFNASWYDITHASRTGRFQAFIADYASSREFLRAEANGSALAMSFFGVSAVTRPTVTGSRGGNAALASFLTAMQSLGLIIDSTT